MNKFSTKFELILIVTLLLLIALSSNAEDKAVLSVPDVQRKEATPAQGQDKPEKITKDLLKEVVIEPGASCINASCHADMEKKKYIHAIGVDGLKCNRCHEIITEGKHVFNKLPPETVAICSQCHKIDVIPPEGLKKSPPKVILEDEKNRPHKPFAEGKCTACHDAHSSDYYKHLKLPYPAGLYASYKEGAYGLCGDCHKDLDKKLSEPRTLSLTMFRNGNVNLHYRHVNKTKGRTCKVCHSPHGLKDPMLLNDTFLFGQRMLTVDFEKTETGGQCATTCHRLAKYDRYKPESNFIKTDPLPGENATKEELEQSRKDDIEREKEKQKDLNTETR
ncbi:MAG: cytochrome c3 family protein [Nitrospirae bacterium]|nr:cytochrome c3 family protein [Nitrospirota bacterium]